MNYFDKRFDRIVKKSQQPSNKNAKMEDIFKFKHKGNRAQFEFNNQISQIVQNLSSALNNDDPREANDLGDDLTAKLKRRSKLIKMADRSALGWDTVAEYKDDSIASASDGKKISQAKNKALTKQKKKSNKPTFCFPSQRPTAQQFWIDGQHKGFAPPSQGNFNLRFPSNNFTQDGYFRRAQWPSSFNVRSGTCVLVVAKEGTGANTAQTPDTETEVGGMKIDNGFSDLSKGYNFQEFEFEKGNNYPL